MKTPNLRDLMKSARDEKWTDDKIDNEVAKLKLRLVEEALNVLAEEYAK